MCVNWRPHRTFLAFTWYPNLSCMFWCDCVFLFSNRKLQYVHCWKCFLFWQSCNAQSYLDNLSTIYCSASIFFLWRIKTNARTATIDSWTCWYWVCWSSSFSIPRLEINEHPLESTHWALFPTFSVYLWRGIVGFFPSNSNNSYSSLLKSS